MDIDFRSCFCSALLLTLLGSVYPACSPVQEGSSTEIDCSVGDNSCIDNVGDIFFWSIPNPADYRGESIVSSCDKTSCYSPLSPSTFEATITGSSPVYTSRLTINTVLRTFPLSLETNFTCKTSEGCGGNSVIACDKLEVYTLPVAPSCSLGDIQDKNGDSVVTVTCTTDKVYPEADCLFYHYKDSQQVVGAIQKSGTRTGQPYSDPVYFSYQCNVDYSVEDLGEGTHIFVGRMYPRVTGGDSLTGVVNTPADGSLLFALPSTEYSCTTEQKDGYFKGRSATCTCSLVSEVYPEATPQWYKDDVQIQTTGEGLATLTFDTSDPTAEFACKGISALGVSQGSTVVQDFAFLDTESVEVVVSPSTTINVCNNNNNNNNNEIAVTCRIHKDNVNPGVTASFSLDRNIFTTPNSALLVGNYYQSIYNLQPDQGGLYQVTCRAQNSIFSDKKEEKTTTDLTFNKPPSDAPEITIQGQPYQDTDSSTHSVTLTEGFTGDITCDVKGGYPTVYDTTLECGQMDMTGDTDTSTLSYQTDPLTRDRDGLICICTAQHVSGCYDLETSLTLDIQYFPSVTLTSNYTELEEGQSTTLTCQSEGNPPPSLTLSRDRTGDVLIPLQANSSKTQSLTYHLVDVGCLDTDTYVCTSSNDIGTDTSSIQVSVNCGPQLNQPINEIPIIDVIIGETTTFIIEIYGYPEPTDTTLTRYRNGRFESAPTHHTVTYTPLTPPYGSVSVTLTDMTSEDVTTYIITVSNSVADLQYMFVGEAPTVTSSNSNSENSNETSLIIGLIVLGILVLLLVVSLTYSIWKIHKLRQNNRQTRKDNDTYMTPLDGLNDLDTPDSVPDDQQPPTDKDTYMTPLDGPTDHDTPDSVPDDQQPPTGHYETLPDTKEFNQSATAISLGNLDPKDGNDLKTQRPETGAYDSARVPDVEPPNLYMRAPRPPDNYVNVDGLVKTSSNVYNNDVKNRPNYENVTLGVSETQT